MANAHLMNLKEQRVKRINEILSIDTEKKTGRILSRVPVRLASVILAFVFILAIACLMVLLQLDSRYLARNSQAYHVMWHVLLFLLFFALVNGLLLVISKFIDPTGTEGRFLAYVLDRNWCLLRLTLSTFLYLSTLFLSSCISNIFSPVSFVVEADKYVAVASPSDLPKNPSDIRDDKMAKVWLQYYIERNYEYVILAVLIVLITILMKRVFLQFISYRIHFKYYKDRIQENKMIVQYLQSLNNITGTEPSRDIIEWNNKIFDSMRGTNETLSIGDFRRFFGVRDGTRIFRLFDIDENNEVTREEFTKRYNSLFREKELLDHALVQSNYNIYKLDCIISTVVLPIVFFLVFIALGVQETYQNAFKITGATLISLSFAFSKVVSDVLQSIIFVFFVRPFDIGDIIEIDQKMYVVSDLGLLYSTLLSDSRYETCPNEILRNCRIKNLRKSTHVTADFVYSFSNDDFGKLEDLREMISMFLSSNPTKYHEQFSINNFKIINEKKMTFTIQIILSCPYQEVETIIERKDKFSIFIHECVTKLGFTYV